MFENAQVTIAVAAIAQLVSIIGGIFVIINWFKRREKEKVEEMAKQSAIDEVQNRKIAVLESRMDNVEKANSNITKQLDKVDFKIDSLHRLLVDFFARGRGE